MKALSQQEVLEAQDFLPRSQQAPKNSHLRSCLDVPLEHHHQLVQQLTSDTVTRYILAFFAAGTALLIRWLLTPLLHESAPFVTLYIPIVFTAWYGGLGPALLTTILGLLGIQYWFVPPADSLRFANGEQLTGMIIFSLSAILVAAMAQTHRWNLQALKELREKLEERVLQRTAELDQTNLRVKEQRESLESANRRLSKLSAELLQAQDEERRRIARDLHDSTGQTLALLSMNLSLVQRKMEKISPGLGNLLAESVELTTRVSADLRTTSYLLHPPMLDEMGLAPALRWYVDGLRKRSQIDVTFHLENDLGRLPMNCETAIFRIVQSALTNIQLHSGSQTALIHLRKSVEGVMLMIKDEGRGIPPEKLSQVVEGTGAHGLGLRGMRERVEDLGGRFEIASSNRGTEIAVVIPVPASRAAAV